jgi:hypothetical protein
MCHGRLHNSGVHSSPADGCLLFEAMARSPHFGTLFPHSPFPIPPTYSTPLLFPDVRIPKAEVYSPTKFRMIAVVYMVVGATSYGDG